MVIRKVSRGIKRYAREALQRHQDFSKSTYEVEKESPGLSDKIKELSIPVSTLQPFEEQILSLSNLFQRHYFDVLGSGWAKVYYGMHCIGLEGYRYESEVGEYPGRNKLGEERWLRCRVNKANVAEALRIWNLIDEGYEPIDWQLDFKSGYRWKDAVRSSRLRLNPDLGVDAKVPWELGRMQHLPQLALAAIYRKHTGEQDEDLVHEFKNCILDFIATNPPRFGMQWRVSMEVAIRVSNWILAYRLFCSNGCSFKEDFLEIFGRSLYEHGLHIFENLEQCAEYRGNHYLANIAGLVFVGTHISATPETNQWLSFAIQELINAVDEQFNEDGSNFEASTSYHRLATDLVFYSTAAVLGMEKERFKSIPKVRFPDWYITRLVRMSTFIEDITKPDGNAPQVGDNDNGRLFKLFPHVKKMTVKEAKYRYSNLEKYDVLPDGEVFWVENVLNHKATLCQAAAVIDEINECGASHPEIALVRSLADGRQLSGSKTNVSPLRIIGGKTDLVRIRQTFETSPEWHTHETAIPLYCDTGDLQLHAYQDFGLYIYRGPEFFLSVRCGSIGQKGKGGHAHNDQLSLELQLKEEDILIDAGTYLYTPLPKLRNRFRSIGVHNSPQIEGMEPANLGLDLFRLGKEQESSVLCFCPEGFAGKVEFAGVKLYRLIQFEPSCVRVIDAVPAVYDSRFRPLVLENTPNEYISPAYGVLTKRRHIAKTSE